MWFYQRIFDLLIYGKTLDRNRVISLIALNSWKLMVKIYNPLVKYRLDDLNILFPASHDTPFIWKLTPDYSKSLGRVARIVTGKYPDATIIDVGANVGDSAAIIRSHSVQNKIISIEGVPDFFRVLERNAKLLGNITPINCMVGDHKHTSPTTIKYLASGNAVVYEGLHDISQKASSIYTESVNFFTLDEVAADVTEVKVLKTDIETYDLPVLNSSLDFIEKNKPVIYMELHINGFDETNMGVSWGTLWRNLISLGYRKAIYWENSSDFLCVLDMESDVTEDIHYYFRNRKGLLYADVCLVHLDDLELVDKIRAGELDVISKLRPNESVAY